MPVLLLVIPICVPLLCVVHSEGEAKHSIPLNTIWAYEMPGTLDVQKLSSKSQKGATELIQQSLMQHSGEVAGPGFAVQGNESEALKQTFAILISKKEASPKVSCDLNTWVVFFAKNSGRYVHVRYVTRAGKQITVEFTFVPHDSKNMTQHFALIPVGKLTTGKYKVSIVNRPMDKRYLDEGIKPIPEEDARRVVSQSFEFEVRE